ncbi:MAG: DUF3307 domain-containing protein [Candidatus Izemoplasmatales bacterium]|nr:DUF3307 domain-containing protein [Candidatus Izemoplasmatales bacterium]
MILLKIMLLLHVIGDFYTQSNRMNEHKKKNNRHLILHVLIYTLPYTILFFLVEKWFVILILLIALFASHYLIDFLKIKHEKKCRLTYKAFLVDQFLHIIVLYIAWLFLRNYFSGTDQIISLLQHLGILIDFDQLINVFIVFTIIFRPTSYFVEMVLPIKTSDNKDDIRTSKDINYGAYIGNLERVAIVLLGLLNLWPSIALVITAKSIARFKQLEDKDFAQKYLIGTLLSLSITLGLLYVFIV